MRASTAFHQFSGENRLVGVVASPLALQRALRLRRPPDYFEIRLDALRRFPGEIATQLPRLRAPLILTARHPAEGGRGRLDLATRRELLLRFLSAAALVDLELRSLTRMPALLAEIRRRRLGLIISRHYLRHPPSLGELHHFARSAALFRPAIVKIVARTDTQPQLARLVAFFEESRPQFSLAVMGSGRLGKESRHRLSRLGSVLSYVSLDRPVVSGQPILSQLRRARDAYTK